MEKEENGKTVGPQRKHRDFKLVRDLGSVKASEFAAEPSESDAESHSLQRYNAEGEAWGFPEDLVEIPGPEVTYTEFIPKRVWRQVLSLEV